MPIRVLAFVLCLTLSACTLPVRNDNSPTEAELIAMAQQLPSEDDIRERFHAVSGVLREICTADEYSAYFAKTPCLTGDMTKRHRNDKTYITKAQKKAMLSVISEINELNSQTRALMIESQIEPYVSLARHAENFTDPLVKNNQDLLLEGKITWGQYNLEREEIAKQILENQTVKQVLEDFEKTAALKKNAAQ